MALSGDQYKLAALAILDFLYGSKIDAWAADTLAETIDGIVSIIRRADSQAADSVSEMPIELTADDRDTIANAVGRQSVEQIAVTEAIYLAGLMAGIRRASR